MKKPNNYNKIRHSIFLQYRSYGRGMSELRSSAEKTAQIRVFIPQKSHFTHPTFTVFIKFFIKNQLKTCLKVYFGQRKHIESA